MSKVRNLPEITTLEDSDLFYTVDESAGPNGGRKITKANLKENISLSDAEVKTAYENNPDTNAFTDAEKAKLATVEANAAFQDADEVPYNNTLSGISATNAQTAIDTALALSDADFKTVVVSGRILHYTAGTARFDGVFYTITAGDILLDPNIATGYVYIDLDGTVKQTPLPIVPPPLSIVIAQFTTDLTDILLLEDQRVKNSQNLVRGQLSNIRDVRAGAAAQEGTSGRLSDAEHKHNILTGAPASQSPNQANAEGVSANLARADHVHLIPTAAPTTSLSPATTDADGVGTAFSRNDHTHSVSTGITGEMIANIPDQLSDAGTVDKFARIDHKHATPCSAPTTALSPATSNSEGVSTDLARADHTHAVSTGLTAEVIANIPDQASDGGIVDKFARIDHKHATPTSAPTTTLDPTTTNSEGVSTDLARADHTHAVSTGLVGDISVIDPDDGPSAGVLNKYARADHQHQITASAPTTTLSPATTNAEGSGSAFARNDHTHAVATALVADITTILPDDSASAGTANTYARGDHKHAIAADVPVTQTPDQSNSEGASTSFSRANHVHNIPAAAPSTTLSPATTNSKGVAASFALSDHTHAVATGVVGEVVSIQPDDSASAGTVDKFARIDHRHAISADVPVNTGTANSEGASTSFARANHVHDTTLSQTSFKTQTNANTTSTTDVLITSTTLTPGAGTWLVMFESAFSNTNNTATATFSLYANAVQVTNTERAYIPTNSTVICAAINAIVTVTAGQAIDVRYRVTAGTVNSNGRSLTCVRLSA